MVYLVRHAKAANRDNWTAPDHRRPLTSKGRRQADGLVSLLADRGIARVMSSPFVRCVETVEPFAAELGVEVEETDALAEGAGYAEVAKLILDLGDTPALLCSHGDVIPTFLDALVEIDGLALAPDYPCAKGSTWILERAGDRYLAATYLPPA
jgi:8-oxo-dGTP diphosphatase